MTFNEWIAVMGYNPASIVRIEWPSRHDEEESLDAYRPVLVMRTRHFVKKEARHYSFQEIPDDVTIPLETLAQYSFEKPCDFCGGEGQVEFTRTTGPWEGSESGKIVRCPECVRGWVEVEEEDLTRRLNWQKDRVPA